MKDADRQDDPRGQALQRLEKISRLLQLNPNDPQLHFDLGCVYKELGRAEDCFREWKKVIELDPNNLPSRQAMEKLARENQSAKKGPSSESR